MSEHKVKISWQRASADFTYQSYSRDHDWTFENGAVVKASATPRFLGNAQCVDPEAAFVASLSSCHMLTFLAICARKGIVVDRYEDEALGHLDKNSAGKLAMTKVELHPRITFSGARTPDAAELAALHDASHHECFIANSVLTEVSVIPEGPNA